MRHPAPAPKPWLAASLLAALLLSVACTPGREPFARLAGLVFDGRLPEISGLAASQRHRDVLWAINDGGNDAALYALTRRGRVVSRHRIRGVANTDWEDLSAFELDGRRYLLVADVGDNGGLRRTLQLHAIAEPGTLDGAALRPAWSVAFRWPDGARDTEAVTVDVAAGQVLLVSKRERPAQLYAVPLRPRDGTRQVARRLGPLAGIPQPSADERRARHSRARLKGMVTAADLSPDGRTLAVMTYNDLLLYRRRGDEPWAKAVARAPRVHELPWIPLAEALAWTSGGHGLMATGEFEPAPLFFLVPGEG